jgi:hypothetical protein
LLHPRPGLWAETTDAFKSNFAAVGIYILFMMIIALVQDFFKSTSGLSVAQAIATALLAIPAHLTVLRGISGREALKDPASSKNLMQFALRAFGLGILSFVPAILVLLLASLFKVELVFALLCAAITLLPAGAFIFARWGTMLPAVVMNDSRTMAAAAVRSKASFSYVFWRLLVCFGLLTVLMMVPVIMAANIFETGDKFMRDSGGIDLVLILSVLLSIVIGAYQVVMTAVILSRAYLLANTNIKVPV